MKKFISIFMSFVMLLSVVTSVNLSAFAAEIGSDSEAESNQKQVVRIRLNPEPDYNILKNSNGEYKEENGVKTWWYNPNEFVKFNSDDTLKINYKKGSVSSVAIFSYSKVKDVFVDPFGETITYSMKEFTYSSENSNKFVINFKLPSNYYVLTDTGLKVDNYELEVNVGIHDTPIIDFQPINNEFVVYGNPNGHVDEKDSTKWHYDVVFRNGDTFNVDYRYKDINGKQVKDIFKYTDGKFLNSKNEELKVEAESFVFDSKLKENEADNKTKFKVSFPNFKVENKVISNTYSVTVAENPIDSFEFITTYTLDKDKDVFKDNKTGAYYKNPVKIGDKVKVKYKNGEYKEFIYTESDITKEKVWLYNSEELNISIPGTFTFEGPFEEIEGQTDKVGNPIVEAVLTDYNVKTYIPIKIIEKAEAPAPDPKPNPDPQPTPSPSPSPSPAPEEPKKDEEKKPEQKPSNNQTVNSTAKNYTPTKVKLISVKALDGHKLKVKWKKCTTSATGYQIYWSKNKSFTKVVAKKQIIGRRYTTYTGKNFTKNKRYYVKIRAFKKVNGKTYYGAWTDVKSAKAK